MAQSTPPRRSPATWAVVTLLLLIAVSGALIVPIYARAKPYWGDFPFFYWYQLIWVPVVALLCLTCYLLLRRGRGRGGEEAK